MLAATALLGGGVAMGLTQKRIARLERDEMSMVEKMEKEMSKRRKMTPSDRMKSRKRMELFLNKAVEIEKNMKKLLYIHIGDIVAAELNREAELREEVDKSIDEELEKIADLEEDTHRMAVADMATRLARAHMSGTTQEQLSIDLRPPDLLDVKHGDNRKSLRRSLVLGLAAPAAALAGYGVSYGLKKLLEKFVKRKNKIPIGGGNTDKYIYLRIDQLIKGDKNMKPLSTDISLLRSKYGAFVKEHNGLQKAIARLNKTPRHTPESIQKKL